MDQYPLLLLALFVSVTEDKFQSKLKDPSRVKNIADLFLSGLTKESQQSNGATIKEVISKAKIHLDLMNEIFPSDLLEVKLEVANQLYLNSKEDFTNWLLDCVKVVEDTNTIVRPCEIDKFIQF